VLIIGSGNVVHNLGRIDWNRPDSGFEWARSFDDEVAAVMTSAPGELAKLHDHDDFPLVAPTPDHFIPLLYLAGLATAAGQTAHVLVDGYAMGSLSMVSYTLGCHELDPDGQGGSPVLPSVPADETNI
jgi:4,5-DOPA dioxygenase extradiol